MQNILAFQHSLEFLQDWCRVQEYIFYPKTYFLRNSIVSLMLTSPPGFSYFIFFDYLVTYLLIFHSILLQFSFIPLEFSFFF